MTDLPNKMNEVNRKRMERRVKTLTGMTVEQIKMFRDQLKEDKRAQEFDEIMQRYNDLVVRLDHVTQKLARVRKYICRLKVAVETKDSIGIAVATEALIDAASARSEYGH